MNKQNVKKCAKKGKRLIWCTVKPRQGNNVCTVQRTEERNHVFIVNRIEVKETEMDSRIITWPQKRGTRRICPIVQGIHLLSSYKCFQSLVLAQSHTYKGFSEDRNHNSVVMSILLTIVIFWVVGEKCVWLQNKERIDTHNNTVMML